VFAPQARGFTENNQGMCVKLGRGGSNHRETGGSRMYLVIFYGYPRRCERRQRKQTAEVQLRQRPQGLTVVCYEYRFENIAEEVTSGVEG